MNAGNRGANAREREAVRHSLLVHEAVVYGSAEELLSIAIPFISEGLERDEPVLAAPTSGNVVLMRRQLGRLADRVEWAKEPQRHKPVERLALFVRYAEDWLAGGARRIRLLGEAAWPASASSPATAEWKRYESYLNVALAQYPIWLLCPYAAGELPDSVVADACRTHPTVGDVEGRAMSSEYLAPEEYVRSLVRVPLPEPPDGTDELTFHTPAEARRFLARTGEEAGLGPEAVLDLELAAGEVTTNVFRHADGVPHLRTWIGDGSFVCEVRDGGPGIDDPFAGYTLPDERRPGGWGLSIARRLCEAVEIRSDATGTRVRLHLSLS
jgi:anti-sigma regulatory factor (Ser/Thr protein kinase)